MSYQKVVWDRLHTVLGNVSGPTISQGDWTQLDRDTDTVVVSRPNGFDAEADNFGTCKRYTHFFRVEVYDSGGDASLSTTTDLVTAVLEDYPTVDSVEDTNANITFANANIERSPTVERVVDTLGAGPYYSMQLINFSVEIEVTLSGGEYP